VLQARRKTADQDRELLLEMLAWGKQPPSCAIQAADVEHFALAEARKLAKHRDCVQSYAARGQAKMVLGLEMQLICSAEIANDNTGTLASAPVQKGNDQSCAGLQSSSAWSSNDQTLQGQTIIVSTRSTGSDMSTLLTIMTLWRLTAPPHTIAVARRLSILIGR
jgi:hypothetical protein